MFEADILDGVASLIRRWSSIQFKVAQYGSGDWKRFCDAHQLLPSMSRRGKCRDNAVAESFFSSLKKERIRMFIDKTRDRDRDRADVFDYIEDFYNRTRRHSLLGDVSTEAFERASIWDLSLFIAWKIKASIRFEIKINKVIQATDCTLVITWNYNNPFCRA